MLPKPATITSIGFTHDTGPLHKMRSLTNSDGTLEFGVINHEGNRQQCRRSEAKPALGDYVERIVTFILNIFTPPNAHALTLGFIRDDQ
jgi:hypothetical protein